jgi:DNA-binding GntR family transcriptional regulator
MQRKILSGEASLAEEITEVLRDRIITGEYEMGAKLIENKIANELKVSRTPVRDAFKQLAEEQLVEYIPNKGCFAKGFTHKDMSDIYAVRREVEKLAIEWAIQHATKQQIADLREHLELMYFYTENNFYEKLLAANEEFHNKIYQMSESRFIVQVLKSYQNYVHTARKSTLKKEEDLPSIYKEHAEIYEALAAGDIERGRNAVAVHLEASRRRAEERWNEKRTLL